MKIVLVLGCLVVCTPAARAQDQVLGLLALPEVFGDGPCDRFSPKEVPLYEIPDGAVVGVARVTKSWTFQGNGGCEGLEVTVSLRGLAAERPLPTREYAYEEPGAVVLETRGRWFRLHLATRSAWVLASKRDEFHSLESLLTEGRLTYLTSDWNRQLADNPGRGERAARVPANVAQPAVRVLSSRRDHGQLWLQIEVMSHSSCDDISEPKLMDRGWVRAHSRSGQPVVWFSSRGC